MFAESCIVPRETISGNRCGTSWFVLHVAPRCDQKVASNLVRKGYEVFAPTYKSSRRWSDRTKILELPLFPGYVFCRIASEKTAGLMLTTAGVIRIVSFGGRPHPLSDQEVQDLRRVMDFTAEICSYPYHLAIGQKVQVESGPLAGIKGLIIEVRNRRRLVVSVDVIMRSISVDIASCDVSVEPVQRRSHLRTVE